MAGLTTGMVCRHPNSRQGIELGNAFKRMIIIMPILAAKAGCTTTLMRE